jgi:hypothetical protein
LAGFFSMIGAPIVLTMLLIALWHGATLPFLLFGLAHAAFLLVNHAWRVSRAPVLPAPVSVALTYLCVLVGSVLFRATTAGDAGSMLVGMAGLHGAALHGAGLRGAGGMDVDIHTLERVPWLLALYAIVWFAPTTRRWMLTEPRVRLEMLTEPRVRLGMLTEPRVRLEMLPEPPVRLGWRPSPRWAVVMGCAATLGLLAAGGTGEFLYFRF